MFTFFNRLAEPEVKTTETIFEDVVDFQVKQPQPEQPQATIPETVEVTLQQQQEEDQVVEQAVDLTITTTTEITQDVKFEGTGCDSLLGYY